MKRILFALALFAVASAGARHTEAADVSIDFFYSNLSGGSWIEAGDYGYCWQPEVAVSNSDWRPYADGYWVYTDVGWTWVSYEDFGWATYHYGRWARLRDHGWVWVPGYEWGPAWVSWRTGGDYVGWAPLPPRRYGSGGVEVVYEGRPIGSSVDIEFDIGPAYYNFVDVRYIGAPVLREHIFAPTQNITYINRTVNVTNITYNNATVYNYGPDYNRLSAYSTRPIQRLRLQRDTAADFTGAAQSRRLTKVQGDQLVVAAPPRLQRPAQPIPPKVVKTKVEKPDVETGWMGVADPNAKAQLQEKMKKEDPKSVPPPQIPPTNPEALNAATSPAPGAESGAAPAADGQRGKGKNKGPRGRNEAQPAQQPAVSAEQNAAGVKAGAVPRTAADEGRGGGKRRDQSPKERSRDNNAAQPPTATAPDGASSAAAAGGNGGERKEKKNRGRDQVAPPPANQPVEPQGADREPSAGSAAPADSGDQGRGRGKQKRERIDAPPQPVPAAEIAPETPRSRKERAADRPRIAAPPRDAAPAPAAGPARQGKPERGDKKNKKDDESKKP